MTTAIGLDLSLASTGLAVVVDGELVDTHNIITKGKKTDTHVKHIARLVAIGDAINEWLAEMSAQYDGIDIAVIEGASHGSMFGNAHERAGLWWRVYEHLWTAEVRIEVLPPRSRAKYITGNGNAAKAEVLKVAHQRWGMDLIPNHDVADATGLAMWGYDVAKGLFDD